MPDRGALRAAARVALALIALLAVGTAEAQHKRLPVRTEPIPDTETGRPAASAEEPPKLMIYGPPTLPLGAPPPVPRPEPAATPAPVPALPAPVAVPAPVAAPAPPPPVPTPVAIPALPPPPPPEPVAIPALPPPPPPEPVAAPAPMVVPTPPAPVAAPAPAVVPPPAPVPVAIPAPIVKPAPVAAPAPPPAPAPVVAAIAPVPPAAPKLDANTVEQIFSCLASGLPQDWKRTWVVVSADAAVPAKFYVTSTYRDEDAEEFVPCNVQEIARRIVKLNDALPPDQRHWKTARLAINSEGEFELKYNYAK